MIRLSKHAEEALAVREILRGWIESTLASPDREEPDPRYPERIRSYKAIAEFGGRVLRVVHRPDGGDIMVITVHFDRGAKP